MALGHTIEHLTPTSPVGEKSGTLLPLRKVALGRMKEKELGLMNHRHVYDEVPDHEAKGHRVDSSKMD